MPRCSEQACASRASKHGSRTMDRARSANGPGQSSRRSEKSRGLEPVCIARPPLPEAAWPRWAAARGAASRRRSPPEEAIDRPGPPRPPPRACPTPRWWPRPAPPPCARIAKRAAARHPVRSHAGQNHPQHSSSIRGRGAPEQHVHCRPAMILRRSLASGAASPCAARRTPPAPRDASRPAQWRCSGYYRSPSAASRTRRRQRLFRSLGQMRGEKLRHVLNHQDRQRKGGGKQREALRPAPPARPLRRRWPPCSEPPVGRARMQHRETARACRERFAPAAVCAVSALIFGNQCPASVRIAASRLSCSAGFAT